MGTLRYCREHWSALLAILVKPFRELCLSTSKNIGEILLGICKLFSRSGSGCGLELESERCWTSVGVGNVVGFVVGGFVII